MRVSCINNNQALPTCACAKNKPNFKIPAVINFEII